MAKSYKKRSHKRRQSQNQQNQNQNQLNSLFGGESAASYVQSVVGSPGEQKSVGGSNAISLTPMSGGMSVISPATITGGNAHTMGASLMKGGKGKKKGGNLLQQLAVPAVLLYANNTFGRRGKSSGRKTRRFRGSRRFRK